MKKTAHLYQTTLIIGLQVISLCTVKAQTTGTNNSRVIYKQAKVRRQKYFTVGFNFGAIGFSPSTSNYISGDFNMFTRAPNNGFGVAQYANGSKSPEIIANTSLGINGGFMWQDKHKDAYTAIQLELQKNKASYEYNFPFQYNYRGSEVAQWIEQDKYIKYSIALQRSWHMGTSRWLGGDKYWYIRESFGQTAFHYNGTQGYFTPIKQNYAEDWTQNGTGMKSLITSVNQNAYMLGSEIGIKQFTINNECSLDIGLVYYAPFASTYTEQYEFFKAGASVGKSSITYNGGTLMCNLRYSFNYHIKDKPVDSTAVKIKNEITDTHPHKINNRHIDVQKTMQVPTDLVTVSVWDAGLVDGDQISLYLNNQLVLENYTLAKAKKQIQLHLVAGANYIVMHAENLGTVPPNTASIEVDDSSTKRHKTFTLTSDMQKSGTIEIFYNP